MFSATHPDESRGRFSLGEAAVLARVEERAARHVLNDILGRPAGRLGARDVVFFALREVALSVADSVAFQRALYRRVHERGLRIARRAELDVEGFGPKPNHGRVRVVIETRPTIESVLRRIHAFRAGARRVERRDEVVGGALVFKGTRVPVATIGRLLKRGVSPAELREDYAFLTELDLEFARIAIELSPPRGRPRKPLELRRRARTDRPRR